jgi:hypothetical protein
LKSLRSWLNATFSEEKLLFLEFSATWQHWLVFDFKSKSFLHKSNFNLNLNAFQVYQHELTMILSSSHRLPVSFTDYLSNYLNKFLKYSLTWALIDKLTKLGHLVIKEKFYFINVVSIRLEEETEIEKVVMKSEHNNH